MRVSLWMVKNRTEHIYRSKKKCIHLSFNIKQHSSLEFWRKTEIEKTEPIPFLRACGPFRGGGSESDSDFEPDWDSEPDRAGRGFSSSDSLSTAFFSDPDPESESESDEAFCSITEKRRFGVADNGRNH